MTREQTKKNLDQICAFSSGKDIQRKYKLEAASKWEDDHDPSWNEQWHYRIKPEPREFWIRSCQSEHVKQDHPNGLVATEGTDRSMCKDCVELIHVKEVL